MRRIIVASTTTWLRFARFSYFVRVEDTRPVSSTSGSLRAYDRPWAWCSIVQLHRHAEDVRSLAFSSLMSLEMGVCECVCVFLLAIVCMHFKGGWTHIVLESVYFSFDVFCLTSYVFVCLCGTSLGEWTVDWMGWRWRIHPFDSHMCDCKQMHISMFGLTFNGNWFYDELLDFIG